MSNEFYKEKSTYRSEIIAALRTLGGQATLKNIYDVIRSRAQLPSIQTNPNWTAQVRKQLQRDSSDAATMSSGQNLFFSAKGLGGGIWGLREDTLFDPEKSNETYDLLENGDAAIEGLYEGAKRNIVVNTFERNRKLREQCIAKFGCDCSICAFNFEKYYGIRGSGFIEVHHLIPISEIKAAYIGNPLDLRPVCSNCHSIIHRFKPFLTINEMSDIIKIAKRK
jgi:hypothetical protein